jgi:SWI/SNF-related matrix-associated actin-dependent regulator 1 of chromatin subfamily A
MGSKRMAQETALNYKLALSRAVDTDFAVPAPRAQTYLPFQRAGVQFASLNRNTLFADPPGVGKTIQAIGFANLTGADSMLVLCPSAVVYNWKREVELWTTRFFDIEIYHPKTFDPKRPPQTLIMPYYWTAKLEAVKQVKSAGGFDVGVIDECQFVKNPSTKRARYILAKNGLVSINERVLALSGTPIENRPMEIFMLTKRLCPEALGGMNEFEFGIRYCGGKKIKIERDQRDENGNVIREGRSIWDFKGKSNMKELGERLRSSYMVRRKKTEVLPQLPKKFPPNIVYLDKSPTAKSLVKRMESFDKEALAARTKEVEFTEVSTERKELGLEKAKLGLEYVATQLESGHEKIVVFAHHREVTEILQHGLNKKGFRATRIIGGMTAQRKDEVVQDFQNNPATRVIIIGIDAASVGITLTASSYVVFVEFSWVPGVNEQAVDRVHRIGQSSGVMTDFLVFEGSLDERMLKYNWEKQQTINEVLE